MSSELPIYAPFGWLVYTDGASRGNPGPAAWAILVHQPDGKLWSSHGSSRKRTNNEAELTALLRGLRAIPLDTQATIYTDSAYAQKSATVWRRTWEANGMRSAQTRKPVANAGIIQRIWKELDQRPQVRIEWVKGHATCPGNNRVDRIATQAALAVKAGADPVEEVTETLSETSLPQP